MFNLEKSCLLKAITCLALRVILARFALAFLRAALMAFF